MGVQNDEYHSLEITLTGSNNKTLKGLLNFTALDTGGLQEEEEFYDSKGAATFVIVVILVYGLSIVLMIGSLAKKNMKVKDIDAEEKQIHRYLNQANDLREKGAKENYRQLKRNIISIVNKSPDDSLETPTDLNISQEIGPTALRSMLAVGSPWAAATAVAKLPLPDATEGGTSPSPGRRSRLVSETESLQALLEEEEPDETKATPHTSPKSVVDEGAPVSQIDESGVRLKTPNTTGVSEPQEYQPRMPIAQQNSRIPPPSSRSMVELHSKPVNGIPQQHSRIIPRVVVSDPDENRQQGPNHSWLKPLDINRANQHHLSQLEKDHKIICNVDGSTLQEPGKSCKLSMDADGNIWILQSSPDPGSGSHRRVPASPSISTPGSIGYESLRGTSPSASPSPIPRQTPSPGVPGVHYTGQQPRTLPREQLMNPLIQVRTYRPEQRERSQSRSPSPKYGCFDSRPQPAKSVSTSTSFIAPGGRRSPNRSPELTDPRQRAITGIRYATSSPKPDDGKGIYPRANNGTYPCPQADTDDEELVQITSV